jgi:GxxExxY protein
VDVRPLEEDKLSTVIIGAAIEVHSTLGGPSLLESVYEEALIYELEARSLSVERQKIVPIRYKTEP